MWFDPKFFVSLLTCQPIKGKIRDQSGQNESTLIVEQGMNLENLIAAAPNRTASDGIPTTVW